MPPDPLLLSVIICTYNRADFLKDCLESLDLQTLPADRFEVLVVDNKSSDHTRSLVEDYLPKRNHFRYLFEEKQGLSNARNRGFAESRGEYLVYLDDDVIVPGTYLNNVFQVIKRHHPDIMGGPVYPYYRSPKPTWFRDEYETRKYEKFSGFSSTCNITGCNYIIRKVVLEAQGLFNPSLGMVGNKLRLGEEKEVLIKYRQSTPSDGQKVYYALECPVQHYVPALKMSLRYRLERSFNNGRLVIQVAATDKSQMRILKLLLEPGWVIVQIIRGQTLGEQNTRSWIFVVTYLAQYCGEIVEIFAPLFQRPFSRHPFS
jgi:glycosyltransferase involved in cell wall biosynthesis